MGRPTRSGAHPPKSSPEGLSRTVSVAPSSCLSPGRAAGLFHDLNLAGSASDGLSDLLVILTY